MSKLATQRRLEPEAHSLAVRYAMTYQHVKSISRTSIVLQLVLGGVVAFAPPPGDHAKAIRGAKLNLLSMLV